jgi:Ricin-type beta-trefoil lectin domain
MGHPPLLLLAPLLLLLAHAQAQAQTARCAVNLTFADGYNEAFGGRGSPCCVPVGRTVMNVPYASYVTAWAPEAKCDRQDLSWQRFFEGPLCTGAQAATRRPSFAVGSVWICLDEAPPPPQQVSKAPVAAPAPSLSKRFVFRSATTRQCLSVKEGVALLGQPRLLQSPCSESDATQGWSVRPAGQGVYTVADAKGRCLATYSGIAVRAAVVMPCSGGADQKWALDSRTPNGKGPYTIRSPLTGACLSNVGKELVQAKCDPSDLNDLFESAFV